MHSKYKSHNWIDDVNPWLGSGGIHFFFLTVIAIVFYLDHHKIKTSDVEMLIYEAPVAGVAKPQEVIPKAKPKPVEPKNAVFGTSRKALVAADSDGIDVKAGNTVAKAVDDKTLKADDPDQLPIPVDEFVVSSMPVLLNEYRVPYPPDAKKAGIQGAVVMDVLIDAAGAVRHAKLIQGPGFGLDEAALEAVKKFQFRPAKVDEKPVAVRIRYSYRFVLEK